MENGEWKMENGKWKMEGGTKMIMYYMIISAQLIFKVARKNPFYNELDVAYNT